MDEDAKEITAYNKVSWIMLFKETKVKLQFYNNNLFN